MVIFKIIKKFISSTVINEKKVMNDKMHLIANKKIICIFKRDKEI